MHSTQCVLLPLPFAGRQTYFVSLSFQLPLKLNALVLVICQLQEKLQELTHNTGLSVILSDLGNRIIT